MYAAPFFLFMQHVCLFANERVIQQDRTWIRFFGRLPSYLYSSQDILGVNNVCVSVCACVCACMVDWEGLCGMLIYLITFMQYLRLKK